LVPYLMLKSDRIHSYIASHVAPWADRQPSIFYPVAFHVSFQMCVLFDDVRLAGRTAYYIAKAAPIHTQAVLGLVALGTSCLLGAALWYGGLRRGKDLQRCVNIR
jgi:hypothetical protein